MDSQIGQRNSQPKNQDSKKKELSINIIKNIKQGKDGQIKEESYQIGAQEKEYNMRHTSIMFNKKKTQQGVKQSKSPLTISSNTLINQGKKDQQMEKLMGMSKRNVEKLIGQVIKEEELNLVSDNEQKNFDNIKQDK